MSMGVSRNIPQVKYDKVHWKERLEQFMNFQHITDQQTEDTTELEGSVGNLMDWDWLDDIQKR